MQFESFACVEKDDFEAILINRRGKHQHHYRRSDPNFRNMQCFVAPTSNICTTMYLG